MKRKLPLEELQEHVATKRRRPVECVKFARFTVDDPVFYEVHSTNEDLSRAWISGEELGMIKQSMVRSIIAYRLGCMDRVTDCIRGLEFHTNPDVTEDKIQRGRTFIALILEQQSLLKTVTGSCNESVVSRMSAVLSAKDTRDAANRATLDAKAATEIYKSSMSDFSEEDQNIVQARVDSR